MTKMTFLGFLMNRSNREEFVAPVAAADVFEAKGELQKAYPESRYALLTIYTRTELEHVLQGVDRWPGLPSKVQQPLADKTATVRVNTGGLPPLPGQVQAIVQPVEQVDTAALPGWMKSFAQAQAKAPAKAAVTPAKPAAQQPMAKMMAEQRPAAAPQSLIDRLKMARGDTAIASKPIARKATPEMPIAAINPAAQGSSVIDILKGMRK